MNTSDLAKLIRAYGIITQGLKIATDTLRADNANLTARLDLANAANEILRTQLNMSADREFHTLAELKKLRTKNAELQADCDLIDKLTAERDELLANLTLLRKLYTEYRDQTNNKFRAIRRMFLVGLDSIEQDKEVPF